MAYRALLVDDNSVSASVLSGLLKAYGIDTAIAESGVAALGREDLTSFQLIFADYLMPEMNGLETLQKIKEKTQMQGKNIFMFLCTGNDMMDMAWFMTEVKRKSERYSWKKLFRYCKSL